MKALKYLIRKEFIQMRRTRAMMAISLGVPVIQLLILGFAISGDVAHIPTVITDLDNSRTSRSLTSRLENTEYLDIRQHTSDLRENSALLKRGKVILSVVIPKNFERDIVRGSTPAISVSADAQSTNDAVTGAGYIRRIVQSWGMSRDIPVSLKQTIPSSAVNLKSRILYNEDLKSVYYMVPGIVVLLVTIITMFLTALAIVREREIGTLEQLMVTPLTRTEMILGKTIPFAILGIIETSFALGVAKLVYDIRIIGSLPLFLILATVYIFCTLGVGILISTIVQTQQQALFMAWFFMVYFILMGGFLLPLESMPKIAYWFTCINPFRYFMSIVRQLFLKGAGFTELLPDIAGMVALAIATNTAAVMRFNKRMD